MLDFMLDFMHAWRTLRRSPGFTLVAITCLALGIGVTTTIFGAVNGILLRPLPFPADDALVVVHEQNRTKDLHNARVSWSDYASWRGDTHSFTRMAIWLAGFEQLSGSEGDPERVVSARVSADLFPLLGIQPMLGRGFEEDDERPGHSLVVVLGYGLWQRRYGGDPAIIGRTIHVQSGGGVAVVIGVTPPGVGFPEGTQLWEPAAVGPGESHAARQFTGVLARLKPSVSTEDARADLAASSRRLQQTFPAENAGWEAELVSLRDDLVGALRRPILIFLGAAMLVLLICSANVANLLLARAAARRQEMAIRSAIGAGRGRIISQVLAESVVLALIGGGCGLAIALAGIRLLALAFPDGVPSYIRLSIDPAALTFALIASIATGLLFGVLPALRSVPVGPATSLHEGMRGADVARLSSRLRGALVIAEIALSLVLMVGATLLVRSDLMLEGELGFDTLGVLTFRVPLPSTNYDDVRRRAFYAQLFERVRAMPNVQAVGSAQGIPFGTPSISDVVPVAVEGIPISADATLPTAFRLQVDGDYLQSLGTPLLSGRLLTPADQAVDGQVGIVNESFVRRYFAGADPIGRRVQVSSGPKASWTTVVGVARNVRLDRSPQGVEPLILVPYREGSQTVVVRTSLNDPQMLVPAVRALVHEMDARVPAYQVQTLEKIVADAFWRQRLQGRILATFAALALALAIFGIYAVISYAVAQRTRELGVRMALGATAEQVLASVLAQAGRLAAIGLGLGTIVALGLTRLLTGLLYNVTPTDPVTFGGVALLLGAVVIVASVVPARRAARIDPLAAMRAD